MSIPSIHWENEIDDIVKRVPVHLREEARRSLFTVEQVAGYQYLKVKPEMFKHIKARELGSGWIEKISDYSWAKVPKKPVFGFDEDF
jgi:hypothetical protein